MRRVGILISGGGSNMVSLLESMQGDHPARPVIVISNNPDAGGLAKAEAFGVKSAVVNHLDYPDRDTFERALHQTLCDAGAELICLAGFMRILTAGFTSRWQGAALNIHPSLLPKYKGLNTHQRAIDAGDLRAGCSVHEVTATLDDGPILGQASIAIAAGDTAATLAARVLPLEHQLYPQVLRRFVDGDKDRLDFAG